MRFFRNAFAAVAVVALGVVGTLAQSENRVVDGILGVTSASASLQVSVSELSFFNFISKGGEIASGLTNLTGSVTTVTKAITFSKPKPFDNSIAEEIVDVLTEFVAIHQALLKTIIGKKSLASKFFLTAPIAHALRLIEHVVDAFALTLISLIPTQSKSARSQFDALTITFTEAIKAFS